MAKYGTYENSFNFYKYVLHIHVGEAFGMVVAKCIMFRQGISFVFESSYQKRGERISLHNYCIREPEDCPPREALDIRGETDEAALEVWNALLEDAQRSIE